MKVWISKDGGVYKGVESFWSREPKKNSLGDFMNSDNGSVLMCEDLTDLKPGTCAEFEIKRVTKKRGIIK